MKAKKTNKATTVEFIASEGLVFFDWLVAYNDKRDAHVDRATKQLLWYLGHFVLRWFSFGQVCPREPSHFGMKNIEEVF